MEQSMYLQGPGGFSGSGPPFRGGGGGPGNVPPPGSKLASYMNRGGQNFHGGDLGNKMNNLSMDHSMKMMNRPQNSGPGFPGPHNNAPFQRQQYSQGTEVGPLGPRPGFQVGPGGRQGGPVGAPGGGGPTRSNVFPPTPTVQMENSKLAEAQVLEGLLREIELRSGGHSGSGGGRMSPNIRGGVVGGHAPSLPTPPPLRAPNTMSNTPTTPTNQEPVDAQAAASAAQVSVFSENGTTYFYNPDETVSSQLSTGVMTGGSVLLPNWSAYSGTPSQIVAMKVRNTAPTALQDNEIKMEILARQMISHTAADPEAHPDLPSEVDNFTGLCPLEPPATSPMHKSSTFGYVTTVYKAVNMKTGQHMCLRRIHGYRLVNTKCMGLVDQWKKMTHSNLVTLRQVFTSKSFSDHSMVFVYDFYPGSETLMARHFRPYSHTKNNLLRQQAAALTAGNSAGLLPESLIWNYVIQLTSALRYIHGAGLACRTLDPTKILVLGKHRLLVNCGGIFDVLTYDPNSSNPMAAMAVYQQEDLVSLGRIVLALSCNSFIAIQRENLQQSMELVTSNYSTDLRNLIMYLLTNPQRVKSVNDLMPMIGARFYTALDTCFQRSDTLEVELGRDIESGRMFRLLAKLGTVVDRTELNMDTSWAETGDRYMLKLFRDYMFHQVMEDGRPFLDMAHIITNLNRLDSGIPDKVCLMSRDEQNVLVVSYSELKNCLEQSYGEVLAAANTKPKIPHSNVS